MSGVRCVVTAQSDGRGRITDDKILPALDIGGVLVTEVWRAPAALPGEAWSMLPPPKGSRFGIAVFPPAAPGEAGFQHATPTIDYGVIVEGEIVLWTDDGETLLRAGDVFVQRAANHAWINRSSAPCRMAVVLVDAES